MTSIYKSRLYPVVLTGILSIYLIRSKIIKCYVTKVETEKPYNRVGANYFNLQK